MLISRSNKEEKTICMLAEQKKKQMLWNSESVAACETRFYCYFCAMEDWG